MKTSYFARMQRNRKPHGFVLLDALVAIVIFSIGILGMVALQASAVTLTSGANYRINAAMLTDQVIGQMWGDTPSITGLQADYAGTGGTGGTQYTNWLNTIDCGGTNASTSCLPGAIAHPPTIDIKQVYANRPSDFQVTVTINWKAPDDPNVHSYVAITQIGP